MGTISCYGQRCIVWTLWTINLFVSSVYLAISLVTFHNIKGGVRFLVEFENRQAFKNSLLASCMLGFLIVLFWIIFSFFVLIGRFFTSLPVSYGVMLGSCSHTGLFSLLAGLVLQTHESLASEFKSRGIWSDADFQTYLATFAFNYILCGTYLLLLLVLIFTSGPFTGKEENNQQYADAKAPAGSIPAPATTGTGTFTNIEQNHGFGTNWPTTFRGGNL